MQTPEKKIEPSVQKMVLFLNLRTHGAVPFSFSSFLCRNRCSSTSSHSYMGRQRIEPSVRKMVLFLNLRTHRAVSFSSAFSDEYTTANLSACDRDRQRPFLNVKQNLPYFKKMTHCSTPSVKTRGLHRASYTLVIGCIETNICTEICVGKLSPRTTLCSPLHRSLISKFSLEIAERSTQVLKVWGVRAPIVRRALPTP